MPRPSHGRLRLVRLGVFVAACLGLTTGGHTLAGAELPGAGVLCLALPPLTLVGMWFTRRERGVLSLFGTLVLIQTALHAFFHLAHLPDAPTALAPTAHAGHHPTALDFIAHHGPDQHLDGSHLLLLLPSGNMAAAHGIVTVLAAVLLGWGERSLWAAARRLLPQLPISPTRPFILRLPPLCAVLPSPRTDPCRCLTPVRGPPPVRGHA